MEAFRNIENSGSSAKEATRKFTLEQFADNANIVTPDRTSNLKEPEGAAMKTKLGPMNGH